MYILGYLVKTTLFFAIDIVLVLMFIVAILSWIAPTLDHPVVVFIRQVVDAVIYPVRRVMMRFEFVRSCPIDLSFTATALLLILLQSLIGI